MLPEPSVIIISGVILSKSPKSRFFEPTSQYIKCLPNDPFDILDRNSTPFDSSYAGLFKLCSLNPQSLLLSKLLIKM